MKADSKVHARLRAISTADAELSIGGYPIRTLIAIAGRTPCYIYDRKAIADRIASLRAALPARVQLHYAVKANPMPAVVDYVAQRVDGLDVASHGEMLTALNSGVNPHAISIAGPAKQEFELACALAAGININCESEQELKRIADLAAVHRSRPRIVLRVNPDFEIKGSGMKMGGSPRPFGIDAERILDALAWMQSQRIECLGFQIFAGSQNLHAEHLAEANRKTLVLAITLARRAGLKLKHLNLGGGYGIPYFPGEPDLNIAQVGTEIERSIQQFETDLHGTEIVLELGRYLVGEAGYYLTRVVDVKKSYGKVYVMVDGGLHHHLANSGNFGQTLRRNYPVVAATRLNEENTLPQTICGPLCTPLDIVADQVALPPLQVGDLIAVLQSGAYGPTASPRAFLSHPDAVEMLV